jgi:hypothetical protein
MQIVPLVLFVRERNLQVMNQEFAQIGEITIIKNLLNVMHHAVDQISIQKRTANVKLL